MEREAFLRTDLYGVLGGSLIGYNDGGLGWVGRA